METHIKRERFLGLTVVGRARTPHARNHGKTSASLSSTQEISQKAFFPPPRAFALRKKKEMKFVKSASELIECD